jgi:2,5-diamino-6-(ribosylamino)-4(3H)-pyrimidinone 5'-phosphate reductase
LATKTEKRLEEIYKLLERLKKLSSKGTPIVVEGKNDIQTLHGLGINGDILSAKTSGKSFLDVVVEIEKSGKREIILLFDFDRRGKTWAHRLSRYLEGMKIIPNLVFWRRLYGLVGRDVKDVEGLKTFLETLKSKSSKS